MSLLAGILAGHRPPGTYRWRSGLDVADVRHAVEHAGWRFALLDGVAVETRDDALAALGAALDFPAYYGRNLDALADCLRDVVPGDRDGTVLVWEAWGPLARAHEPDFTRLLGVLAERAGRDGAAPFAVLLRGPGPERDDVPELG